jgi:hypothetical protein
MKSMRVPLLSYCLLATAVIGASGAFAAPDPSSPAGQPQTAPRRAAPSTAASCNDMLPPLRVVKNTKGTREFKVGPTACQLVERKETINGREFVRLYVGLNGKVDGHVSTNPKGDYRGYMTNAPDLVFPQTADSGPIVLAIVDYLMADGAMMSIFYPADTSTWNGKVYVTVHGATTRGETLVSVDFDKVEQPVSAYDEQMLARGYIVVKTRRTANAEGLSRNANPQPTGLKGLLETDRSITYAGFNDTHNYIRDFTLVAESVIKARLGRAPTRTYFYGHSAGGRMGRGFNYTPGLNRRPDGRVLFDGFLVDDSGAGTWLPIVMKDGKDVQFAAEADKAAMVPQLEIVHQGYNNIWETNVALGVTSSFLENKRTNARIMRDKGLTPKFRAYEVRAISHAGSGPGIDVAPLFGQMFDMLDAWADKGVEPPPTRSDWKELGDVNRDGVVENPGISLPEVSCPLGVVYPTTMEAGNTLFAPFTGKGLEPLDRSKYYVDMNRNGVWDYRETPSEAWQRLGLLQRNEELTREKYVSCVQSAADLLAKDGFLSAEAVAAYVERAKTADLMPKEESPATAPQP